MDTNGSNKSSSSPNYRIKSIQQVQGDWFCVSYLYEADVTRCFIQRVMLWALLDKETEIEHVAGLDSSGIPFPEQVGPNGGEIFYVSGADMAPDGRIWAEIYQTTKPSEMLVREFTDSFANVFNK